MSVSPADFELYSRVTGTPYPRTAAEQMQLAPQVHHFIRNRGYSGVLPSNMRNMALLGAAGLALAYANKKDGGGDDDGGGGGGGAQPQPMRGPGGGAQPQPIPGPSGPRMPVQHFLQTPSGPVETYRYDPDQQISKVNVQVPHQAPRPAATFQDYQELRKPGPGGPLARNLDETIVEANVREQPSSNPLLRAADNVVNQLTGRANPAQLAPGADLINSIQPNLPAGSSGGALGRVQADAGSDLATSGDGYLSKIRSNPYQSTGQVYETDNSWVNPLNRLNQGQFLRKNPRTVTDPVTGEDRLVNPASTGRSEVSLGLGASGFRPGMRNLPTKLGMIWSKPNLLPEGHHSLIGDAVGSALTGVTDLVAPEVGVPLHIAKFAAGGLGQAANFGMRGLESAGAIVPAVAEHALLDSADLARMVAQPAVAGLRTAASYAPGIVRKGVQDMDVTGREIARVVPDLYSKAAERGGEDYQRGVIKPTIEYMGERASADLGKTQKWEQAVRTAAAAKAISAISQLADHPQQEPNENKVVPNRDLEKYDDRYPYRHGEDDHIDGFEQVDPKKDPWR